MLALFEKIESVEAMKSGRGIQYILDEAYKILGNPLLMYDMDYRLLAYTGGVVTDDFAWNTVIGRKEVGDDILEIYKNEGFIEAAANSKSIAFFVSDNLAYGRIFGKVHNKDNKRVASVESISCNKPFEANDFAVFDAIRKSLSKEICDNVFYQHYGETYQESMITRLVDGNIDDKGLYVGHVASIYEGLQSNLYVAVVDVGQGNPGYENLSYYKEMLRRLHPTFKYSIYAEHILIIISSQTSWPNIKKDLNKLERFCAQKNIYAGISGCFENIYELRKHYLNALAALNRGDKRFGASRVYLYDELAGEI